MNRILLSALLCPLLGLMAHAQAPTSSPATHDGALFGAYQLVPSTTPVVQEARAYLQSHLPFLTLEDVPVAYVQIVDGTNVKLICTSMEEGRSASWKFVTFRSPDGLWHLGLAERL